VLKPLFDRLAAYNAWANRRLYDACHRLSEREYYASRKAFFGSIHRTLNHLLVADRIWLSRLAGSPSPGLALDAELYAVRDELRAAREALDARLAEYVGSLDEADLAATVSYQNIQGQPFAHPRSLLLQHLFNHQTHHRGQIHDMLSATEVPPPPLDIMYFVREEEPQASTNSSRA
jgi:uncharacterized damage-inducible protein DinB